MAREVDLRAGIVARAFKHLHPTLTKLGVKDFAACRKAVRRRGFLGRHRRVGKAITAAGRFGSRGISIGRPIAAPAGTAHTPEASAEALVFGGDPFQRGLRQFVKKRLFRW